MYMATPEERDRLCGFSLELFSRLEAMQRRGSSTDDLVVHLRQSGVLMPVAPVALRKMKAATSLVEARAAVDSSAAYAKWPAYDETYPEIYKVREATAA